MLPVLAAAAIGSVAAPKNVLFIVVDDMRPNLGAYNFSLAHTPNLDKLAAEGLTFQRAYVQYAFCAPSRNSFMSGRRPDTTRVWNFHDDFREPNVGANWSSLPEYFKRHGWLTLGSGKLYHPGVPADNDWARSWSTDFESAGVPVYYSPECMPPKCPHSVPPRGNRQSQDPDGAFSCLSEDPQNLPRNVTAMQRATACPANTSKDEQRFEYQLEDQRIRDSCIGQLNAAAALSRPFFVGCGFHKPHVPWEFPHEFLDHFPSDLEDIPLADDTHAPVSMPDAAWHYPHDVHGLNISFNATCNATRSRNYRRAYYASVAYTDDNIGRVLGRLEALHLAATTLVAVLGDHGWQLGEHDTWSKMTNFEVALRVPLIIRAPWKPQSVGKRTTVLAEATDIYPTLAALAGLPAPQSEGEEINGTSLEPVFDAPGVDHSRLKPAAFSQFAKPYRDRPYLIWPTPLRNETQIMGYSVRVDSWRYTCWFGFDGQRVVPRTHDILGRELYDHRGDSGELDWKGEHINVVDEPQHAPLVQRLHQVVLGYIQLFPTTGAAEVT
jgi:iduronate 2-sulfatase